MADTSLKGLPGWTDAYVERLAQSWITTAEQVVAVSATEGGLRSVAEQLGVPEDEARHLVESARAELPPAVRAAMDRVVDTSEYGLGVLRPPGEDQGR